MAKIERMIDGVEWSVWTCGTVAVDHRIVLLPDGEPTALSVRAKDLRTAFALRDEWEALRRKEDEDKPPSAGLPPGFEWRREDSTGPWCIAKHHNGIACRFLMLRTHGEDLILARAIVAAAEELEARKAGEKAPNSFKTEMEFAFGLDSDGDVEIRCNGEYFSYVTNESSGERAFVIPGLVEAARRWMAKGE